MRNRSTWALIVLGACTCAQAQWVNHPTPGTPRTKDGKANLSAPAPRAPNGKPDLSGVWQAEGSPIPELIPLLPGGENGLGEDIPTKYFIDILADFKPGEAPLRAPAAGTSVHLTVTAFRKDDPGIHCLPSGVPMVDTLPIPFKIVQTPGLIMMLMETDTTFRQIFTDGRKHPADSQPSWMGYSVGKWEGDTLVVDTTGFNDLGWLDDGGHPQTEALHVTERFRRRNFGHIDLQVTIDDPKAYSKPWTVALSGFDFLPDEELIESICDNEKDVAHMVGK